MTMDEDAAMDSSTQTAQPRLLITKMELENFKSYAGVKEIGPFHKCFSAVVGPNGSGKSNVIDAMLFVFGKRASKLRLKKVSELIHKSDAVRDNPPTYARVSVFFQDVVDTGPGDDDYTVVPGSEVVVSRIARSDNSSSYKIDGKTCQFKDVAAYLDSKGIDLDNNRFLILQGEVEMISMMPPKGKNEGDEGLLEYLEDIIGSSQYVHETEEASLVVEALTEQRQEKLNRVKAVEKEKDSLEAAKQEAEALLSKDREIRSNQNVLFQINQMKYVTDLDMLSRKKESAEESLAAERHHLDEANQRVAELEKGLKIQRKEYDHVHSELTKTKEEFAAYERRDIKLREEIKHNKTLKKKMQAKVKLQTEKIADSEKKAVKAQESIPQIEREIERWSNAKVQEDAALEVVYDEMKGVTQSLREELEEKTLELAPISDERVVFQASLDTAETEVQLLKESVSRAQEKLNQAEFELANLDQTQEAKRHEMETAQDDARKSNDRLSDAVSEEAQLQEKEGALVNRYNQLLAQSESAQAALQSNANTRSSAAVQGILKAVRNGGELSKVGVLGRLGDLATIADEYDVAISTACGHLDFVVVQTTAGAERCLQFVRKNKLGRVSFVPLDKMKKGAHDRVVETPEGAPRLFDLINPANPFLSPAIFLAVGDTLVAPDLETATRWAYDYDKRWRVVTLDGKLIETSGTMAGGGNRVSRGGMKLASGRSKMAAVDDDDELDVEGLKNEVNQVQVLLHECRNHRKELQEEIRTLKKNIKLLESKSPKLTVELAGCDTTREELTKVVPELRAQAKLSDEDEINLARLTKKVSMCKTDMSSCAMKASKLEAQISRLQKAIMDAGGAKLKKQQLACENALTQLNAAEKALNAAVVAISSMTKAVNQARTAKDDGEQELDKCCQKLENLLSEFKLLEVDALEVMKEYEKAMEIEAKAKEGFELASKECEDLKKSHAENKFIEVELVGKIEDLAKQISECDRKKAKWAADLENLRAAAEEESDLTRLEDDDDSPDSIDEPRSDRSSDGMDLPTDDAASVIANNRKSNSALPVYTLNELERYDRDEVIRDISVLEGERNAIAKHANMGAIAEYRRKEVDYLSRVSELDRVTEERNEARKKHEDLRRLRLEMFLEGFGQITLKLKEMYQMITLGGDAELELVDSLDPFSEGIVFSVRPPKKSWKNISNLSGGEKTLSSLALVFALHHFKPTPLYVMDEIDAALDFKNVSIVANYIKQRTRNAQFIIISLRNNMFELADRLVGIYKTDNCTKSVSLNPRAYSFQGKNKGCVSSTPGLLLDRTGNVDPAPLSKLSSSKRKDVVMDDV